MTSDKIASLTNKTGGDYVTFKLDDLTWYVEKDEVYVYEGTMNAEDDVVAVYLDTSEGPRIIIPFGRDKILRDALSRQQSSAE